TRPKSTWGHRTRPRPTGEYKVGAHAMTFSRTKNLLMTPSHAASLHRTSQYYRLISPIFPFRSTVLG
ncbi:hypothetical protein PanWU01x14_107730, partial [Parasponia andersonii]